MRLRFALASLSILFSLLALVPVRADSVIHNKSSNYVRLHADSSGSFAGATVTDTSTSTPADATAAPFYSEPHPPYQNSISAPISMVPTTGLAKDQLKGIFDITYVFGNTPGWPVAPVSDGGATWDHLEFNIDSGHLDGGCA
jgi:hypothetical protein